jgi:nickel-dependent lactate racemase
MEDAPFDAIKNGFAEASVSPAKALVVGPGGKGFDDSLSSSLRGIWSALPGVRKAGAVLLVAECSEGLGSPALEMVATGRISGEPGKRREKYVEGLEEVFYLNKLMEEYDVLLLSGLPEVYAKSKLGLTTARGSGEAVGRLLNKVGRTGKVNVVPRACESRIASS